MRGWKNTLIPPTMPILKAIEKIDVNSLQIALIVDAQGRLLGTVTDGDIRRGILKGIGLNDSVSLIMNKKPVMVRSNISRNNVLTTMKVAQIRHIPVVDEDGRVVNLEVLDEVLESDGLDNWVVLMAGGLGSRLSPLTDKCPKPLLKVGSRPILETILENFMEYNFRKFYISLNYRGEMIRNYFGDGSRWGAEIRYIYEDKRLGTAGALSLLPEKPSGPLLVMNGDLLTKVNFKQLLEFHLDHKSAATMCVREYDFQVPFGVVKMDSYRLRRIDEKPVQRFFVNAGIYVLEPRTLEVIPQNQFFDMPELFDQLIKENQETVVFPIREYWMDIGHLADFERANGEFSEVFK
jgi:dTDP-glucose pyrophosphorylase/CBS domain-containing protein